MVAPEELQSFRAGINSVLDDVGVLLGELTEGSPAHEEAHVAIDEQLQHFFQSYYSLRQRHEQAQLSVAVLALTKSGKAGVVMPFQRFT